MNRKPLWILLSLALAVPLAAAVVPLTTSVAHAEPPADEQPEAAPVAFDAPFQRYVLAPDGKVTGLVLADGTTVQVPRHAGPEVGSLRTGEPLHVEGKLLQTPTGPVLMKAVVQRGGKVLADGSKGHEHGRRGHHGKGKGKEHGQRAPHAPLLPVTATGKITALVSSPRGHVHAVLLDDGTSAAGGQLEKLGLKVGDRVTLVGQGGTYPQGKAMRIEAVTLPSGETRTLPPHVRHPHDRKGPPPGSAPA